MKIKATASQPGVQHVLRVLKDKAVKAMFGPKEQSKIGGAALLLELEKTEGLVAGAAACLRDPRVPAQVKFSLFQMLWQRVLLICCGYEDAIDGAFLKRDPGLKLALGFDVASQPTICRFENKMSAANCYRLAVWLVLTYIMSKGTAPKAIRLDFDGSCIPTRGQQQGSSYRKYYDTQMYFPLFVFDQDGALITAILRPGEDGEAGLVVPVLKRLVKVFRSAWPQVEITVVMDAGFNSPKIYDWCEDQGKNDASKTVFYLIKLKDTGGGLTSYSKKIAKSAKTSFTKLHGPERYKDTRITKTQVEKEIRRKPKKARKEGLKDLEMRHVRKFGEFVNQTGKGGKDPKQWRCERRILAQAIHDDWGGRRSFWVTNIKGGDAADLINNVYSRRGEAELRIRDAKAFRCDKLSCQEFMPNQFRLLMHVLAQRLLVLFRAQLPAAMQHMSLEAVKENFLKIPALVQEKARTWEIVWSGCFAFKNQMHALCYRLTQRALATGGWALSFANFLKSVLLKPPMAA